VEARPAAGEYLEQVINRLLHLTGSLIDSLSTGPAFVMAGSDKLAYLARYFNAVEINTSNYGPPSPR